MVRFTPFIWLAQYSFVSYDSAKMGIEEVEVNAKGAKSGFCRVKVAVKQLGCWGRVFHLVFGRKNVFTWFSEGPLIRSVGWRLLASVGCLICFRVNFHRICSHGAFYNIHLVGSILVCFL